MNVLDAHYGWALAIFVIAGLSDGLDGLLARWLQQKTTLGGYLDPIADKLLLSSMFLVLSFIHEIPWRYTVLVFSRDISILLVAALLYATTSIRDFRPSIFGKLNTFSQVAAVFFVLLTNVHPANWVTVGRRAMLYATAAFTIVSGVHYVLIMGQRLHNIGQNRPVQAGRL